MKKIIISLLVTLFVTLMISSVSQAKQRRDCTKSEREVDTFLMSLEKSMPTFEKQAEVIIKLLNSDKHRAKIIKDLDEMTNNHQARGDSTHIYKAMKSFKLEKDLIFKLDKGGQAMPFYNNDFLKWVTNAGCYPRSYTNSLYDITSEQWLKTAEIMDKVLGILTPLRTVASEKISIDDLGRLGQGSVSCGKSNPSAVCLYSFLYPVGRARAQAFGIGSFDSRRADEVEKILEEVKTPPAHLEMMKKYYEYLSQLPTYNSDNDWDGPIDVIDGILIDLAESGDMFSDLEGDSDGEADSGGDEKSGDLNFDDLKLPD